MMETDTLLERRKRVLMRSAPRNRLLFRVTAGLVAFLYAYMGFVASLRHTDDALHASSSPVHAAVAASCGASVEAIADKDAGCAVCVFLASLVSPALAPLAPAALSSCAPTAAQPSTESFTRLLVSRCAPRAPPAA